MLGADALADFPHWHRPDAIIARARLALVGRPVHAHVRASRSGHWLNATLAARLRNQIAVSAGRRASA